MTPQQPSFSLGPDYDPTAAARELALLHDRINKLGLAPNVTNLKTDHSASTLSSAASTAAALNATNAALNTILEKLNLTTP